MPDATSKRLKENLDRVNDRLVEACRRAGRARSEVTLVAVTKTVSTEMACGLVELGVHDLGENRPQELWRKTAELPKSVRWHLIGHLQRNKIERTLPVVERIHSVDSIRLLEAIETEAAKQNHQIGVFLEVNASGEASKQGFDPSNLPDVIPAAAAFKHVRVEGLMTMAPLQDAEACRPTFAKLRNLRDELAPRLEAPHRLVHLSMGMSNDFEVAVEEGATFVRLGSVLFEGVKE
ncbi:MAG: YggS family pyridoxal phosphate-dependent enzyme [Planctomycetes bacterium]|nr:YggS family pyridoxal phosphate-dependent enzyme [Planctomycetota bacterium]